MAHKTTIYKVQFATPPLADGKTEFYFSSLAAIYETFSSQQIGCAVQRLYNLKVSDGVPYEGKRVTISREVLVSKAQANPNGNQKAPSEVRTDHKTTEC